MTDDVNFVRCADQMEARSLELPGGVGVSFDARDSPSGLPDLEGRQDSAQARTISFDRPRAAESCLVTSGISKFA